MVDTRLYNSPTSETLLCETFSTEGLSLLQMETETIYRGSVVDVIEGYSEDGKPYSRFTYIETDKKDESEEE